MKRVALFINGMLDVVLPSSSVRTIKEDDLIQVKCVIDHEDDVPDFLFEDFRAEVKVVRLNDEWICETAPSRYFSESFGFSVLRIQSGDEALNVTFDVLARKTSAEQARKMIAYLAGHGEAILSACFSRSSMPVGAADSGTCDPEMILTCAESFLELFQSSRIEFSNALRERLVPAKLPFWSSAARAYEVDPMDVLSNLDSLAPAASSSDVYLRGRHFSLSGMDVSVVHATADVEENHVILGGIYGIRKKVSALSEDLSSFVLAERVQTPAGNYESFQRLLLSLTADGMLARCGKILDTCNEVIRYFEVKLKISYRGEIQPRITPYVRASKVYRQLFNGLSEWYSLGAPVLEGVLFLMKLKSLSKIYELYVFFHLLELLLREGWSLDGADRSESFGEQVPSCVRFGLGDETLTVMYEPVIPVFTNETADLALVDTFHFASGKYPYWCPDFVFRFEKNASVKYLVVDAKYSTAGSVKDFHLPRLFEKYYLGTSVYHADKGVLSNSLIMGVIAIFSLASQSTSYLSYWRKHGLGGGQPPRLPLVGGVGLMVDNASTFEETFRSIIHIIRREGNQRLM